MPGRSQPRDTPAVLPAGLRSVARRPLAAAALLLLAYGVLSLWMNPTGTLGTDTGAKVATLEVMDQRGSARPGLGYWAERWDPDGSLHPIFDSHKVDDDWVHVTTLPMLELARPLYAVGGYRLTLLLPMLGAVGAAFAARSLARRIADESTGWQAFWVVGLASPILIYALDFWEHAPGVACIVGAVALLAGVVDGRPVACRAVGAGALLGLAATMRTEAFVYAIAGVGLAALWQLRSTRAVRAPITTGALSVVGFAVPWVLNSVLESALGGTERGGRVEGAASGGLGQLGDRVREAAITLFAIRSGPFSRMIAIGVLVVVALGIAVAGSRLGKGRHVVLALGVAFAVHLGAIVSGLGFVPGLFAAAPIAVAAVVSRPSAGAGSYATAVAIGALPLVWAFQFIGGALPQWGGRYALSSATLLVILGVIALREHGRELRFGLLALSILVSASGASYLHHRTNEVARVFDYLVDRPEDVVVSRNGFFIREGGARYTERRWLSAPTDAAVLEAAEVVDEAGLDSLLLFDEEPESPATLGPARFVETVRLDFLGIPFFLHTYEIDR